MEIKINIPNISEEQFKRLKDFGLGGITQEVMRDMKRFESMEEANFFKPIKIKRTPLEGIRITSKTIEKFKDGKRISREDFENVERIGRQTLRNDLVELFETKKKKEILNLVLTRLNPHDWAKLVQGE